MDSYKKLWLLHLRRRWWNTAFLHRNPDFVWSPAKGKYRCWKNVFYVDTAKVEYEQKNTWLPEKYILSKTEHHVHIVLQLGMIMNQVRKNRCIRSNSNTNHPFILRSFKLFLYIVASPKLFTHTTLGRNLLAGFEPTNPASEQTQIRRRVSRNRQFMLIAHDYCRTKSDN
jgi:hypothetical protein